MIQVLGGAGLFQREGLVDVQPVVTVSGELRHLRQNQCVRPAEFASDSGAVNAFFLAERGIGCAGDTDELAARPEDIQRLIGRGRADGFNDHIDRLFDDFIELDFPVVDCFVDADGIEVFVVAAGSRA